MSLKATPLMIMGNGVASSDDMYRLRRRGCLPLHSLHSLRQQVPSVTQMTPSGCFARMNQCPCLLYLKRSLTDSDFYYSLMSQKKLRPRARELGPF